MTRRLLTVSTILLGLAAMSAAQTVPQQIPGQRPMLLIEGTFKLTPGTWALYDVLDKQKNEPFLMTISILNREAFKEKNGIWMEIEVKMKDMPLVITDALVEEGPDGPGDVLKAVVQVEGVSPFKVPEKFLKGDKQEVGQFEPARIVKRLEQKKIDHKGRTIDALVVEAENSQGQKVAATVSLQILPIALYMAETDDMKLTVNDWGTGAKSKLQGEPVGFTLWLIEMIGKELGKIK